MNFNNLYLDDDLIKALDAVQFKTPTAIQEAVIPHILDGKDVLAGAATGTGKTAAFVLPVLQHFIDEPNLKQQARALILTPTRELAFQLQHVVKQLAQFITISTTTITGGFSPAKQIELGQGCDILIATPGRLLSLVAQEQLDISDLDIVIIDEADRMLDIGQGPDVLSLLSTIANGFQACLFSATLSGTGVDIFADELLRDAEVVQLDAVNSKSAQVSQGILFADDKQHKQALLLACLNKPECQSALIFCNKKDRAIEIADWLQSQNISAQVMHGDFKQAARRDRTRKFRTGQIKVMVATDVAARGLDLPNISHIINYDLPIRGDIYIHRIGRTGRGQQTGAAINLVEHHDLKHLERIEYHLKAKLPRLKIAGLEPKSKHRVKGKKKSTKKKPYIAKKDRTDTQASSE